MKVELCKRIEEAFDVINECFDLAYNTESVTSVHDWGSSTLEMIDDAIRTYKTCVAKIDKKLSNLNYE